MRKRFSGVVASLATVGVAASVLLGATPAMAEPPELTFETVGPVEVAFGQDWVISLSVAMVYEGVNYPLSPADGTVDVSLSGIPGTFAPALPIQAGGVVYVSQSISQPLVPAGEYQVSAIFNPAPGSHIETAQTPAPLVLKVTALDITPTVAVEIDERVSDHPVVTASLAGSYVDAHGAPAGTWHFDLMQKGSSESLYKVEVAQAPGESEPVRIEIDKKLEKGSQYVLESTFAPVDAIAGGVTVAETSPASFETRAGTFAEALAAPVPLPVWGYVAILIVLLGLIASTITLGLWLRGRGPKAIVSKSDAGPQHMPGDPINVEVVSLEDMGLPDPTTIPELLPDVAPTQKLPTSTTWLLSDVEPVTTIPDPADAPTERIDAVTATELGVERDDTTPVDPSTEKLDGDEAPKVDPAKA